MSIEDLRRIVRYWLSTVEQQDADREALLAALDELERLRGWKAADDERVRCLLGLWPKCTNCGLNHDPAATCYVLGGRVTLQYGA